MKILYPEVELYDEKCVNNKFEHFAKCARICYASKGNNDKVLYKSLWNNGHRSMYRHISRYYIIPIGELIPSAFDLIQYSSYIQYVVFNYKVYVSTNEQFVREHELFDEHYGKYEIDVITAFNNKVFYNNDLLRYTFVIRTGIDITRELNRTSPNNTAEQSTRYVDFNKKLGITFKKSHWMYKISLYKEILYKTMCKVDEWFYKISRSKYGLNLQPQDARWCLFLDTNSKVAYTYSVKEWKHIINLRYKEITGKAHPDAKYVIRIIVQYLKYEEGYDI